MVGGTGVRAMDGLASAATASQVIAHALAAAPAIAPACAVGVYRFTHSGLQIHAKGASERAVARYLALPIGSDPLLLRMQQTRTPVHEGMLFSSSEWRSHPLYDCAAGPFGFEHYLVSPLIGQGELVGALTLARGRGAPAFTQHDLLAIAIASAYVSVALAYTSQRETSVAKCVSRLNHREREIAALVAKGLTNSEIGCHLRVSSNTVKKQLKAIFAKLEVSRRAELAWLATLGGVVP